jgi:uncharacterized Tic20 family protein
VACEKQVAPQLDRQQQNPQAGPAPHRPAGRETRLAMLAYLTVPLLGFAVPLAVRVIARHGSGWLRGHASQALNVWITAIVYDLSAAIMGAMLALGSPLAAVLTVVPLMVLLWLVTLAVLVRAAAAASRGGAYTFPRWLCSQIVR